MQYDWGEVHYEQKGQARKLYGFTAVLGYSRMRFVTFVKRCDTPTMIRCMMEAFEYFDGFPRAALTDRMKSVFLEMEDDEPKWNPLFADFMTTLGIAPRVCKPYKPQTKGKVERSVGVIKKGFGQESVLPILIISTSKRKPGVIDSTRKCIAPPDESPWICGSKNTSRPCPATVAGIALGPRNARSVGMASFPTMGSFMVCHRILPSRVRWSWCGNDIAR